MSISVIVYVNGKKVALADLPNYTVKNATVNRILAEAEARVAKRKKTPPA